MNGSPVDSVYNLKRRIASLPPTSADSYAKSVATSLVSSKQESLDASSSSAAVRPSPEEERAEEIGELEDLIGEQAQSNCCLFCYKDSDGPEINLKHMSSEHGLYIPEIEHLSSLETIVGYLRTVVTEYHECLYCGMIKHSAEGIRRHMLDKGHCMINLDREPELLEFWEFSDSDGHDTDDEEAPKPRTRKNDTPASSDLSQGEYILPSGKVIGSRSKAREARLFARRTASADEEISSRMITEGSLIDNTDKTSSADPVESLIRTQGGTHGRAVAARDAVGLVNVSEQQMRSLITVQRKMQRQQAIVRASAAWAGEKGGNHQKHYKVKMNLRAG
jgi:pre-60S factor REI1